jgi:hypothetical protein
MRREIIWGLIMTVSLIALAHAELKLSPVHRDEPAEYTFETRFSLDTALSSLQRIQGSLESFRKLTDEVQGKVSKERLKKMDHTDWETQHVGFPNYVKSVEGTLRKQEYLIKKLQFQLLQGQVKQGTVSKEEFADGLRAFEQAEKSFQEFWDKSRIAD